MNFFPDSKGYPSQELAFPGCHRFVVLLITCFLSLSFLMSVPGQESAPDVPVVEDSRGGTSPVSGEALRMSRIQEKIRMNSRVLDPFGFSMTSGKKAPEFVVEPEEVPVEEEQERPPSGLTSRAVGALPLTGIYPSKNQIVVRGRPYEAGASLSILIESVMVNLIFVLIEPGGIRFRDADTGEEVVRPVRTAAFILPEKVPSSVPPEAKGIFPRSGIIPIR